MKILYRLVQNSFDGFARNEKEPAAGVQIMVSEGNINGTQRVFRAAKSALFSWEGRWLMVGLCIISCCFL